MRRCRLLGIILGASEDGACDKGRFGRFAREIRLFQGD